jgi:hypothetical protein
MERPLINISFPEDADDKDLVILAVFAMSVIAMLMMGESALSMVDNALTGLFGVAVGKATAKGGS